MEIKKKEVGNHLCKYEDKIDEMVKDIKLILKLLNGNGQIGLCAKVNILWASSLFIIGGVLLALIKSSL